MQHAVFLVAIAAGAVVVLAAAAEALYATNDARSHARRTHVLRWGRLRAIRLEEGRPGRRVRWVPSGEFIDHAEGHLERRPYAYDVDDQGFLAPSILHERPEISLVFQGGSTTEIVFVDPELRFPYLTGRLLERRTARTVNSCNAGVSGSHTLDSINALLNKHAVLQPTFVVMMEAINDLNTLIFNHNDYYGRARSTIQEVQPRSGRRDPSIGSASRLLLQEAAATLFPRVSGRVAAAVRRARGLSDDDEFAAVRGEERHVDPGRIRDRFRRNLLIYARTARALGITPILMTQANRFDDPSPGWRAHLTRTIESRTKVPFDEYRTLYASMNDVIRDVGEREDVLVIDLASQVPGRAEFIHDAVHFNSRGSILAAHIISEAIVARCA